MIAALYACLYLACGTVMVRWLLPQKSLLIRVWLGLCLGFLMLMWCPALGAFALGFTVQAHILALLPLALFMLGAWCFRDRRTPRRWDAADRQLALEMLWIVLPLTVLGGYLQYTHTVRVAADGAWHVGQSTYGDLPMHMAFVTGITDHAFPPEYPFMVGQQLSYPFLMDSLSSTFYLLGFSLQASLAVPGTVMMALLYTGVLILARSMTGGKKAAILAVLFFFLNGGLGFLYNFDQAAGYEWDGSLTLVSRIRAILEGYYQTPTNQPEPNNLRWSNLIADLLVPQRTLLGGYCMVVPCIYLLWEQFHGDSRGNLRTLCLLGIWGGLLPLIHTHSFLALGLMSLGLMLYDAVHEKDRKIVLLQYLLYGGIAVVCSAGQLFGFTFRQVFQGGEHVSFVRFQFNWVNNPSGQGMRDFYFWFYIKNIGLPFLLVLGAAFEKKPRMRALFAMALPIVLVAELIRFQPNEYDNNKLFYLAWLLLCMPAADYAGMLWHRLRTLRAARVMAVAGCIVTFLSAGLTLWRECVSDYVAFGAPAVEAGLYAREETEPSAVFCTGTQHLNPVLSIAGRHIVCGPDLWLYWHGIDTSLRKQEIASVYTAPENAGTILEKYQVDYIYLSSYERSDYGADPQRFDALFEKVFENSEASIYKVR